MDLSPIDKIPLDFVLMIVLGGFIVAVRNIKDSPNGAVQALIWLGDQFKKYPKQFACGVAAIHVTYVLASKDISILDIDMVDIYYSVAGAAVSFIFFISL